MADEPNVVANEIEGDPSNTDIELLTAPLADDDDVLTLVDRQNPDDCAKSTPA